MRASSFVFAAVAGVAVGFLGAPGANAMTGTSPAGVRVATEAMDTSALVHCRPYRHWHEWEHRRTFGCREGSSIEFRRGHRVHVREGSTVRGEIRSGTTTRERTTIRSGTSTTGQTTTKSGTSGGTTGRAQGEKSSTGGSSSGPAGGTSGAQPGGQKQ